ncbi:hypothetical protein PVT71_00255 [Salipiger sp. H15]|uniref:Helicase/UvrB N-terminal domain-containing protein n=1 Tax=Alloyangia sp. H15 TaxID=3029062 RepID=A0AAU8AFR2_9RHOB
MNQAHRFQAVFPVPDWRAPEDARRDLEQHMDVFIRAVASEDVPEKGNAPALTLKVSAGVGKTSTALRLLARHGRDLLASGHVLFYVPTLDLADRAAADLQALDGTLPISVVRGRLAHNPETGTEMCKRSDLVERMQTIVPSVTRALCRVERAGEIIQADCAANCPYLAQRMAGDAGIHFMAHSYLGTFPPIDRSTPIALRVIDEKVWPSLVSASDIRVEEFLQAPTRSFPVELQADLAVAKSGIVAALQNGLDVRSHLRVLGLDQGRLAALARAEADSQARLDIHPKDSQARVDFLISTFDQRALYASRKRQALFDLLASAEAIGPNRLTIEDQQTPSGQRQTIRLNRLIAIDRDAPLLMLDADADPLIADRLAQGTSFVAIEASPRAEIVQISDRTLSNTWLLDKARGSERRAKVLGIVKREVERAGGQGVLLVATKAVLAQLHADLGHPLYHGSDAELTRSIHGATTRWFGPKMLGVNDFERYRSIILVGRLQPDIREMEQQTRALFLEEERIEGHQNGPLPETPSLRVLGDGTLKNATSRSHADPRVRALLRQVRECATMQAIARLRLISPSEPKRVVLLCSMPLPELPVSKLVTLETLYHGLEDEPDPAGYLRLERSLRATMGQTVRGTRVSAAGLAADLPADFESLSTAKEFRRGRETDHMLDQIERIAARNAWPATRVQLSRRGHGGRPTFGIVLAPCERALFQAGKLWPELTATVPLPASKRQGAAR